MDKKFRGTFVPGSYDVGIKNALDNNFFGEKQIAGQSYDKKYMEKNGNKSSQFAFSKMARDNIISPKSQQKRNDMKRNATTTVSR